MRDLREEFEDLNEDEDLTSEWLETTYDSLLLSSQEDLTVRMIDWEQEDGNDDEC